MAEKPIGNPLGAFGYTDLQTGLWYQPAEFKSSAAITAKRLVSIGTDGRVATTATDGTASLVIGVAVSAIASASSGEVIVAGIAEDVSAAGAVAAGDLLKRSATTAGYVSATATPVAGEVIGVAINASASNVVDVWIAKTLSLS